MGKDSFACQGPYPPDGEQRPGHIQAKGEVGVEFPEAAEGCEVKRNYGREPPHSGTFDLIQYLGLDARICAPAPLDFHQGKYLVLANPGEDLGEERNLRAHITVPRLLRKTPIEP